MNPINFSQSNLSLTVPEGEEDRVQPLHVCRTSDEEGDYVISCWKGGLIDRLRFLLTGKVWFWCWGSTHPPICLDTKSPSWGE